jgi:flagellar motor switch/type III secretory pathway protein FliN
MSAQPLLFLGDRRRTAVAARADSAARRWRQHWVPGADDTFEAECEAPHAAGFAAPVAAVATSCWALDVAGERVAVLLLPHGTFAWCVLEPGAASLDLGGAFAADSLADQLEQEVARSLLTETCLRETREVASVTRIATTELAEWSRAARAWTLSLRTAGCARGCALLVAASRLEQLAPARTPMRGDLLARRDAVGENVVELRAVVGEASMSVTELAELAVDDVLVLDQRLTDPVTLVSPGTGAAVAAGNLGRSGARRAIKVAGIPAKN